MWVEKYAPRSIVDWVGDRAIIDIVISFIESWLAGKPYTNALILSGDAGCGKTSIVYAIAKDLGMDVHEANASDLRTKRDIKIIRQLAAFKSFGDRATKIVLLDEADNIHRGAWRELEKMVETAGNPIILTANYPDKLPYRVRQICGHVEVLKPDRPQLTRRLQSITKAEGLDIDIGKLERVADICPSVRSAIMTLEMCVLSNNFKHIEIRDVDLSPIEQIRKLFTGKDVKLSLDSNEVIRWGLTNRVAVKRLRAAELIRTRAKEIVGLSDVLKGYIGLFRAKGKIVPPPPRPYKRKPRTPSTARTPRRTQSEAASSRKMPRGAELPVVEGSGSPSFDDVF